MKALALMLLLLPLGAVGAAADGTCSEDVPPCTTQETKPECEYPDAGQGRIVLRCGEQGKACGVAQDSLCWTMRYSCFFWGDLVRALTSGRVACEGQPSQPSSEPVQVPGSG